MAKIILNIAKAYDEGFIENLERTKYFQLHKNATTRAELYCFALALCEMEKKEPTPINSVGPVKTFVRAEFLENCEPLLSSLYYDKELKNNPELIDEICNRENVYCLAEKYANTGFGILQNYIESMDEETLFYKLIGYMDKQYDSIKDELTELI
ncbi:hypothetical protein [uncultured Bacteroides sp.]|jgi:hypothetical protein|uniref:hypothetical protein n=1 Tax=uncultured Bacteroides sp. TaxID=162156 RepID=UPI0025F3E5E1|nr:hypothetical protein [uncultured Bacteroides sp.]